MYCYAQIVFRDAVTLCGMPCQHQSENKYVSWMVTDSALVKLIVREDLSITPCRHARLTAWSPWQHNHSAHSAVTRTNRPPLLSVTPRYILCSSTLVDASRQRCYRVTSIVSRFTMFDDWSLISVVRSVEVLLTRQRKSSGVKALNQHPSFDVVVVFR